MVFQNNIIAGAAGAAGYTIDQSIRFNDDDSAFLYRTPSSTSNRKTYTVSLWFKIGNVGKEPAFFVAGDFPGGSSPLFAGISLVNAVAASPTLSFSEYPGGASYTWQVSTNAIFRDPSAWYHFVGAVDTTQATASDRVKLYVNGELQTDLRESSYPSLNHDTYINSNSYVHRIGRYGTTGFYADGYMAEFHFIDGTALDPTSFGKTNSTTGQWVPIEYTGSYGTNGFYITGADSADLGADDSGNGNDFTSSGLTAADQMPDTPTDNFITWNPLVNPGGGTAGTFSNGNLDFTAGGNNGRAGTIFQSSGKWYVEWEIIGSGNNCMVGIVSESVVASSDMVDNTASSGLDQYGGDRDVCSYYGTTGTIFLATTNPAYGNSYANGDIIGMALDLDNGAVWFSKNGTWQNSATIAEIEAGTTTNAARTGLDNNFTLHFHQFDTTSGARINAGQAAFTYTQPTGFSKLSTTNLPDPTIADPSAYFQTTLYTGNGTAIGSGGNVVDQSGNSTFQPDFVWIKNRDAADNHMLYDAVRGATKDLHSNEAAAEVTDTEGLSTFDTDGFTVGSNVAVNTNTENYAAWQWKANGAGSSNADGSINSTVSNNSTSNFSIVKYTGTGSGNSTVGHGLGVTPDMILLKHLDRAQNWRVFHTSEGVGETGFLNDTAAFSADPDRITAVSSTTFTVAANMNESADYIAYCFAEVEGFSKFGSYTGNGSSDGPFIYTGFTPEFIMVKSSSNSGTNWDMLDATREPFNTRGNQFFANTSAAEANNDHECDFLSNGFKWRDGSSSNNGSGYTIIYMAFAKSPFKTTTAQ